MTRQEELDFLASDSRNYTDDEFELYIAEAGWQEWMGSYAANDDETPTESEFKEILEIQYRGFMQSHPECGFDINSKLSNMTGLI